MSLFNFKTRFVPKIENGTKKFTCRYKRKVMPKVGQTMHMKTGPRFKPVSITNEHTIKSIQTLSITIVKKTVSLKYDAQKGSMHAVDRPAKVELVVDGLRLGPAQRKLFYEYDGFDSEADFVDYWTEGGTKSLCEELFIFHWTDFKF